MCVYMCRGKMKRQFFVWHKGRNEQTTIRKKRKVGLWKSNKTKGKGNKKKKTTK